MAGGQIPQQLLQFWQAVLLGMGAGVLYDALRPFRCRFPRSTAALDLACCLAVLSAAFRLLLFRFGGELRGFLVLGAAGGTVVYACGLSGWLRPLWSFWADTAIWLAGLAAWPLRRLVKILKKTG